MKITKSQLKQIIKEELDIIYERKRGRRGISPMYRMATGGGGAYSPSDDSVVDFLSGMIKDKIEDYRKKQKEKEDRINPELTDKYMKKAGMLHPDEEVPGEEEERRLSLYRSSNRQKLNRLMGRNIHSEDLEEIIRQELDEVYGRHDYGAVFDPEGEPEIASAYRKKPKRSYGSSMTDADREAAEKRQAERDPDREYIDMIKNIMRDMGMRVSAVPGDERQNRLLDQAIEELEMEQ